MEFSVWIAEVDRIFVARFWIAHVMGGFSTAEMEREWLTGEAPLEWVERVGE